MPARLGVNVDHVATLRQSRRTQYPDPVAAAMLAELGGADQITIHLREDRRHVQERDLQIMRKTVSTRLNLEMAATQEMVKLAYEAKPDVATLVPERREELTTEGGLDVVAGRDTIRRVVKTLHDAEIKVSLFIDPDLDHVKAAHRAEADVIELHTGRYCDARLAAAVRREPRVAVAAGVELDDVRLGAVRGLHVVEVGVDEERHLDLGVVERLDDAADRVAPGDDVEPALGGEPLAPLRDEGRDVRLRLVGDLHHVLGRGHLAVEPGRDGLPHDLEVALLDVAAILAEVDRDLVGAAQLREHRGGDRVRVLRAAGLAERRDVVDVDAKASGHGGNLNPRRGKRNKDGHGHGH